MSRESIRALVEAATPGPWHLWHGDDSYAMNCYGVTNVPCDHELVDEPEHDEHTIALTLLQEPRYASLGDRDIPGTGFGDWDDNAAFIAASRTAVPLLLAVADAAVKTLAVLENWDHNDECESWAEGVTEHPGLVNDDCDCGMSELVRRLSDPLAALEAAE